MHPETIHINQAPPRLPHSLLPEMRSPGGLDIPAFRFSQGERAVLRKRRQVKVSAWAEKHRILTKSAIPGPWRNEFAWHMVGIMDAAALPYVRKVVVCKPPQSSGTEGIHNFAGNRVDRDPGDMLYVFPDELMAKENMRDRILPMINASPRLRSYKTNVCDDEANLRVNLRHMAIYIAWAGSSARLGNKPIKHLFLDEVDKYPKTAGTREAGVIALAEKRCITYKGQYKEWIISTPTVTTGNVWVELHGCAAQFRFYAVCPDCGASFIMDFDHIRFPEDERDPVRVRELKLAWYECHGCGSKWDDQKRNRAVLAGAWKHYEPQATGHGSAGSPQAVHGSRATGHESQALGLELFTYLEKYRPQSIGFQYPAWISYFVSLSDCAASFLKAFKAGGSVDKIALRDFCNAIKAEPWLDYHTERSDERILHLRDTRPEGIIPGGGIVAGLTAGVDTQDNGFWYEIRAWSWGHDLESWQVRHGFCETFSALERILFHDLYRDADGREYIVEFSLQDAMGHRTSEVYDFCRLHRGRMMPLQGVDRLSAPYTLSQIEFYPGTKKPIPGGLRLARVHTNFYKDTIARKLDIQPGDPGAWHYYSATTMAWARSMVAEYVGDDGTWQCPDSKDPFAFDCSVYALAAADVRGIKFWQPQVAPDAPAPPGPRDPGTGPQTWLPQLPGWFKRR